MKKSIFFLILLLIAIGVNAQKKVKVACIGNSVTYGYLLKDREHEAYPAQLQLLLGNGYEVQNFGKSGTTLLSKAHRPYIKEPEYKEALGYAADIVVIHLGLNDTDPRNWPNYRDDFFSDYLSLIDSFRNQNPDVKIWICRMSPIFPGHPRFVSGTRDWYREIQTSIESVARFAHVNLIDLEKELHLRPDLFPDYLHPTKDGAAIIAKTVCSALTGNYGGLKMSPIYTDDMILQRNRFLTIQGTADSNEMVTVKIGSQNHLTVAGHDGRWKVILDPLAVGKVYTMEVSTKEKKLVFKNILAGEVWLCSGQSNMAFTLSNDADFNQKSSIKGKTIRMFDMKAKWETNAQEWDSTALEPLNRLDYYKKTTWTECSEHNIGDFSAVAYYFGKMLADSLNVPVGLIHNAVGGSPLEAWIDRQTLENRFPEILKNWTENDFIQDWVRGRAVLNIKKSNNPKQRHPYEPSYLFESGIIPLNQYPINGVVWYQGESNAHNIDAFERLFPLFIESWRRNWNASELPFYYVQLSSLNRPSWTWFRDAQRRMMDKIPNIYMAVSSDRGDSLDVHPRHKKDIGERLALWALSQNYNKDNIIPSGPLFKSADFRDDFVMVSFDYSEGMRASDNKTIEGFDIAEIDGLFYPATAKVEGDKLRIHSPKVKKPQYIRYGWQPFTRANLINNSNLPASTFRAEKKELINMKDDIKCESLPDYPIERGVAGVFIGVHKQKLIVAGGCNFPQKPASEGGEKVFYKDVYVLDLTLKDEDRKWVRCASQFPYEVAYGASVNTDDGIICIGGQNQYGTSSDVTLVQYDEDTKNLTYTKLPSLPVGHFNGDAAILNRVIYIAGGSFSDNENSCIYSLDLKNKDRTWSKTKTSGIGERQQPIVFTQNENVFIAGGYNEGQATASTDVLKFDEKSNKWLKYANITPDDQMLRTFVGATGVTFDENQMLFVGGVNHDRFETALNRIKNTQEATRLSDASMLQSLLEEKNNYMSQDTEWYKFNKTLLIFNTETKEWGSLGDYDQLARAGAGVALWNKKLYIVCGELKPGIRTNKVNCLHLE